MNLKYKKSFLWSRVSKWWGKDFSTTLNLKCVPVMAKYKMLLFYKPNT